MARIYKQRDKWCFAVEIGKDEKGNRRRKVKGGFLREKDARKAAIEYESKYLAGVMLNNESNITLHDFMWNNWLNYYKNFVKPATLLHAKTSLKKIDSFFVKSKKIRDITATDCNKFSEFLLFDANINRHTAGNILINFKQVLKYAFIQEKILSYNPSEYTFLPKYTLKGREQQLSNSNTLPLYMEKDVLIKFLNAAKMHKKSFIYYTLYMLMAYTGMRVGEVLALQWEDIDLENKIIHVRHGIFGRGKNFILQSPKTKTSYREIDISDTVVAQLKKYRKEFLKYKIANNLKWQLKEYDFVFTSMNNPGLPFSYSTVESVIKQLGQQIGVDYLHSHIFRHTHVSLLAEAGASLEEIRARIGHSNDKITAKIYLHITKNRKKETAERFEKHLKILP